MAKKDKGAAKAAKKARGAEKAAKAANKAEAKTKKQNKDDEEDVDIDTILNEFKRKQEEFEKVKISQCARPSQRQNATLIASPQQGRRDLLLFGGEAMDSQSMARFYNDLFVWSVDTDVWRKVESPNSPLARCGHAMCPHPSGIVILHGGEFSSPRQTSFHHYGDTWVLDATSKEWTRVDVRPAPGPRSGHRMCVWKNYILMFGGFKDLGTSTMYLGDLWAFDVLSYKWHEIEIPQALAKPDPRSGHSLLATSDGAVLVGGYSKVKAARGQQHGKVHTDTWALRMKGDLQGVRWERRKRGLYAPSPRAGCSMALHHGRGVMFGGVYDTDETEEEIRSVFYNQLYSYNLESNRWFVLTLRPGRRSKMVAAPSSKKASDERDVELQRVLESLDINIKDMVSDSDSESGDDEPAVSKKEYPVVNTLPHARFNAALAVLGDTLFIYDGTWENKEREFAFNSMYSIDLAKLDGLTVYWEELGLDTGVNSGDEDSEDEGSDAYGSDSEAEDELRGEAREDGAAVEDEEDEDEGEEEEEEEELAEIPDPRPWLPHPKPFETVTQFYRKHVNAFVDWALKSSPDARGKDLKRVAFELAQARWWERREAITIAEDQLEEMGGVEDVIERTQVQSRRR